MQLQDELNKLTKQELISLFMSKRIFLRVEKRDITMVKIKTLSKKAEIDGKKALDDMDKYGGKNHLKWLQASKDHDKAMKIYDKINTLYEGIKICGKFHPLSGCEEKKAVPFNEVLYGLIEERDSWISVNERRPNEHDDLLVYYNPHSKMFPKARYMTESSYYDACFEIESDKGCEVTHWQPLPEPPKAA